MLIFTQIAAQEAVEMSSYVLMVTSALTIMVPASVAIANLNRIEKTNYPFLWLIFLSTFNEILLAALLLPHIIKNSSIFYNVFFLLETLLIIYQLKKWDVLKNTTLFWGLMGLNVLVWLPEMLQPESWKHINSVYSVFHSLLIMLLSMHAITQFSSNITEKFFIQPRNLICFAFIFFYFYSILTDVFISYQLNPSLSLQWFMLNILNVINIIVNGVYVIAIIRMAKVKRPVMPAYMV